MDTPTLRARQRASPAESSLSPEHYIRLILHRKSLVLGTFLLVSLGTVIVSLRLPNLYKSETVILVDPQRVPESYVKATVTGDVRNRLSTLSQQILSATRLQKIIETMNLYPQDRKTLPREDVITRMRADISVNVLSELGGGQDLQAFRIIYRGREPRIVAQVANALASLFIEENLKAREEQATGTADFLQNQLQETRKTLEAQEAKLKDFKLKHLGEMPEQQTADLQILGQLQSQLQLESDALARSEQQKSYIQSMMAATAPVVDLDEAEQKPSKAGERQAPKSPSTIHKELLAKLLVTYTEKYPAVARLKKQIEVEELLEQIPPPPVSASSKGVGPALAEVAPKPVELPAQRATPRTAKYVNPVLQSQLKQIDDEIAKHREERQRVSKLVANYQVKLEAIPVREQQVTDLVRDYEISKGHYSQLLEKQLSAETATQLEIRQKGERFSILDPAQPAERPSQPNRILINGVGSIGGLALGLLLALITEFLGMSITSPEQITAATGLPVLEVIPVIRTHTDRRRRKRLLVLVAATAVATVIVGCVVLMVVYHYRPQAF
jgi:succinoglycan biosynthesis transport protein ExoP